MGEKSKQSPAARSAKQAFSECVLITGGTSGLGYECAATIAQAKPNALVLLASRTDPGHAADSLNAKLQHNNVRFLRLDLASQTAIRAFADDFSRADYPPLSALVLNAALQVINGLTFSPEGIETGFAVNHLGSVLLLELLRPAMRDDARIVITASGVHDPEAVKGMGMPEPVYTTAERLARPDPKTAGTTMVDGQRRYATSKLCNVLFMHAFARRLKLANSSMTVTAMDPGKNS